MPHGKKQDTNDIERFYINGKEGLELAKEAITDLQKAEYNSALSSGTGKVDWRGRNGGIKTLGIGISAEFVRKGHIDLRGKEARSPEQLAILSQVFRDPRYETFRLIYMKGNTVAGHEGITSKLPNASVAFPDIPEQDEFMDEKEFVMKTRHAYIHYFMDILDRMERLKADGYYLLHNHPSAVDIVPSYEDLSVTESYRKALSGFRGHVIINSNKYCFISKNNDYTLNTLDLGEDPMIKPSLPHPLLGLIINSSGELAKVGKTMQVDPDYSVIIYINCKNSIRAIQEVPDGLVRREKECVEYLRGRMRDFGASKTLLVTPNEGMREIAAGMVKKGYLLDAIITNNCTEINSVRENGVDGPRGFFKNRWMGVYANKCFRVNEKNSEYPRASAKHDNGKRDPGLTI